MAELGHGLLGPRCAHRSKSRAADGRPPLPRAPQAAHEAAEKLRLPLALLWQAPLGMCLMNAGQNRYNLRPDVPVEVAPGALLQPAAMGPLRRLVNEAAQLLLRACMVNYSGEREALRAAHGLPRGVGAGLFGVPARVARLVNVVSCVPELVRAVDC